LEKKGASVGVVTKSKSQRGKKTSGTPSLRSRRVPRPRKGKARSIPSPSVSSDSYSDDEDYVEFLKTYKPHDDYSSGSDEIDEDYAEFLKTYDPQESYPGASSFDEAPVQCEGVSKEKEKEVPAPSKTAADLD
jgi:hypothetical protein